MRRLKTRRTCATCCVSMTEAELDRVDARATVEPKLTWLQSRLELDAAQLKKIVVRHPQLLGLSVEDNLEPKLDWLRRRLDLDDVGLRKMVLRLPSRAEANMRTRLAAENSTPLKKVVLMEPQLLSPASRPTWRRNLSGSRRASTWTTRS